MGKVYLSTEFHESYAKYISYPLNLVLSGTKNYYSTLESYKARLDENEAQLCLGNEKYADLPIRDFYSGSDLQNCHVNIHTSEKLCEWLGVDTIIDEIDSPITKSTAAATANAKCRFVYIYGNNSRDKLRITRNMLTRILTYHQVMPAYLDFIFVFGAQSDAKDLRFSGFRQQTMLKELLQTSRQPWNMPGLNRSGRQFQLCYNLKGVTLKKRNGPGKYEKDDEWSIRQAAIHHQFDVVYGTTLWIVTKGRLDIKQRFEQLTGPDGLAEDKSFDDAYACFRSSLAAHLMFCHWSTEDWRGYISWLEEVIHTETSMALYGPRGPTYPQYEPRHIQDLQRWKDQTSEAVMVLEANMEVMKSLRKFYVALKANRDFPLELKQNCKEDIETFAMNLDEIIDGLKMHTSRARLLVGIIGDRKELILQHLQGQTAERTDQLNRNLEKEAIVMRIVTIVTLLYLPATFVSTFFSTDIVQYQNTNKGTGSFSPTAMKRWLEVTLPLTTITLLGAWLMYQKTERTRYEGENQQRIPAEGIAEKEGRFERWKFWVWGTRKSVLPVCNEAKDMS